MSNVEQLKENYKKSLVEKAETLMTLYEDCKVEEGEQTRSQLHNYLHKLAGSLGMYGFSELSDQSRSIMNDLHNKKLDEIEPELSRLVAFLKQQ